MALLGKARTATGAGVIITVLLVLVFGNQAFTEWVVRHTDGHTVWGWFLRILSWPAWAFGPTDSSSGAMRNLLAQDLRAILLVVFVALVLGISAKSATGGGAFVLGWASLIFGSALAAFLLVWAAEGVPGRVEKCGVSTHRRNHLNTARRGEFSPPIGGAVPMGDSKLTGCASCRSSARSKHTHDRVQPPLRKTIMPMRPDACP